MSDTKVDMPKVCQMFDAGWMAKMYKNDIGSYTVEGTHRNRKTVRDSRLLLHEAIQQANPDWGYSDIDGLTEMITDDFTPEQALTRLAYKVHGEII